MLIIVVSLEVNNEKTYIKPCGDQPDRVGAVNPALQPSSTRGKGRCHTRCHSYVENTARRLNKVLAKDVRSDGLTTLPFEPTCTRVRGTARTGGDR